MTLPVDFCGFWSRVAGLERFKALTKAEQKETFLDGYMLPLRRLCAKEMSRRQNYRRSLKRLVWETCQVYWESISRGDEPFPFASLPPKGPSDTGLTTAQSRVIIGCSTTSPQELIDYLQNVRQVPQPEPDPVLQPSCKSAPVVSRSSSLQRPEREASSAHSPQPSRQLNHERSSSNTSENHHSEQLREQATGSPEQDTNDAENAPDAGSESDLDQGVELGLEDEVLPEPPRTFGPADLADLDHWAYAIPGSSPTLYQEAPKLPTCGPWEVPLPPTMDPQVHVQPSQLSLQPLLGGVRIQIIQSPPRLKVESSGVQRAAMLRDSTKQVESDYTALRWQAYRHLLAWAEHLKSHAELPAERPMDLLAFVRMRVQKETESIRRIVAERIENRVKGGNIMFPGRSYQMPEIKMKASPSEGTRKMSMKGEPKLGENGGPPAKRKHGNDSTSDDEDDEYETEGEDKQDIRTQTKTNRKRQRRTAPSLVINLSSSPEHDVLKREDSPVVVDLE
ncbi:hypothetical protein SODALDRAFT_325881 [Sodiomyces alkalinus F11]|uniref:Uncharacterized protein n=1 Tax=Sodiomyces alkalinus (strain CBS 110278 / VKM F-3762 / F11) TaxID=1314773 RepID=A0A3N2PPX4_SODAK|nr:hypothetical protein SODALDRAFT_325881 [Sodiomyces alkalinus F11]ROT36562.1 hypothetical protein SODALDRAFT_325881 [Sodiomyces alkalinus F11]